MPQSGYTPIQIYSSSTPTNAPSAGNLTNDTKGSELAINIADKNLFFKDSSNVVNTVPIRQSGAASDGWLSSTDWNTFNNKQPAGAYLTSVTADAPLSGAGTSASHLVIAQATTSTSGYLSSTDWNTFNNKQPAGTYVTSVTGTAPVVSSGGTTPAISMAAATTSVNGYLTSTDWNTFNGKQAALVSGTNIKTVNGTTLLGSGDLGTIGVGYGGTGTSTAFTAGSIVFAGASGVYSQNNSNLFWDNSNVRLGVATATPGYRIDSYIYSAATLVDLLRLNNGGGSNGGGAGLRFEDAGASARIAGVVFGGNENSGLGLAFYTSTGSSGAVSEQMRLWMSGGLSLGNTTDPGATNLSVTGSIAFANISNGIAKTGTFTRDSNSASGNVSYTGVGFKPSLIVFYAAIDTLNDFMVGSGNATAGRALYNNFSNSLGASSQAVAFYYRRDFGGGDFSIQSATIASMDSDGFTLAYTRTVGGAGASNSIIVNYIAYK